MFAKLMNFGGVLIVVLTTITAALVFDWRMAHMQSELDNVNSLIAVHIQQIDDLRSQLMSRCK